MALGDDRFWDHGQVGLAPGDALAFRQRLEMVLAELTRGAATDRPELMHVEAALRRQCLWELRAAREASSLAGRLDADEWTRFHEVFPRLAVGLGIRDGERAAEGDLFHEFEERGCVGLMRVLTGEGGLPLLIGVVRAFICQGLRRLLRFCLQERPEQTPAHSALVMDVLRELSTPRFSARRATTLASSEATPEAVAAEASDSTRPIELPPQPRRYERRQPAPDRPPSASPARQTPRPSSLPPIPSLPRPNPSTARTRKTFPTQAPSPRLLRGVLVLGIVLLVALPAWLLVSEAQQKSAEQRRVAAERQRLAEELRRLDEERRILVERQQRLAEAEAARRREAERQRREEEQRRRAEAEQARRRAEEQAVRQREAERKQREVDRLRASATRRSGASGPRSSSSAA